MTAGENRLLRRFKRLIEEGDTLALEDVDPWVERARLAVGAAYGNDSPHLKRFDSIRYTLGVWTDSTPPSAFRQAKMRGAREALGMLQAMAEDIGDGAETDAAETGAVAPSTRTRVFVVHGRNEGMRDQVARFLERLSLEPIVLEEQADRGRTIIEKFEEHALEVDYAVVLLTPEDYGHGPGDDGWTDAPNRARQNVILELGYFMGTLKRARTAAIYARGTELPSDIHGLLYIPFDDNWKLRLAKEMRDAGLRVDLNSL